MRLPFKRAQKESTLPAEQVAEYPQSRVIEHGKLRWVFGMHWFATTATDVLTSADQRKIAIDNKNSPVAALVENTMGVALGTMHDPSASTRGLYSAAAAFAMVVGAEQNAMISMPLDESRDVWWFCACRSGLPNPLSDVVGSKSEIDKLIKLVCATAEYADISQNSLYSMLEGMEKASLAAARLSKRSNLPVAKIRLAFVLLMTMLAGWYGLHYYQSLDKQRKARIAASFSKQGEEEEKRRQQEQAINAKKLQYEAMLSNDGMAKQVQGWLDILGSRMASGVGWDLSDIKCTGKECTLKYNRKSGSLKDLEGVVGKSIITFAEPNVATLKVTTQGAATPGSLDNASPFGEKDHAIVINLIQKLSNGGVTMKFDQPAKDSLVPVLSGKVVLTGNRYAELREALKAIEQLGYGPSIFATTMSMQISNVRVGSWKIEGAYVFRDH